MMFSMIVCDEEIHDLPVNFQVDRDFNDCFNDWISMIVSMIVFCDSGQFFSNFHFFANMC